MSKSESPAWYTLEFLPKEDSPTKLWKQHSFADIHSDWESSNWNPVLFFQYQQIVKELLDLGYWYATFGTNFFYLNKWVLHLHLEADGARLETGYYVYSYDDYELEEYFREVIQPTIYIIETLAGYYTYDKQLDRVIHRINDIAKMIDKCKQYRQSEL